jgi:hypothetical protein
MAEDLPLFVHWEHTTGEVLDRTLKFPKAVRFTFSSRIDNLTLDILEGIVAARYAKAGQKDAVLREVDSKMTRLRVLLRLSHQRSFLSHSGYERLMELIDEAGRMLGGWRRQQEQAR